MFDTLPPSSAEQRKRWERECDEEAEIFDGAEQRVEGHEQRAEQREQRAEQRVEGDQLWGSARDVASCKRLQTNKQLRLNQSEEFL